MDEKDIVERIEKLEKAVFGESTKNEKHVNNEFTNTLIKIEKILEPLKSSCDFDD